MRRVGIMDLYHAARVVQAAPVAGRVDLCTELLWQAHVADKYVKRLHKTHPKWGDGSLRAAALARASKYGSVNTDLMGCLALVLSAVSRGHELEHVACSCKRLCTSANCAK